MTFDPPPLPPAGWYPDPERPGGPQRWWNGASWAAPTASSGTRHDLPDIGGLLNRSFAAMWRRWRALLVIGLVTTVPAGVLASLSIRFLLSDVFIVDDDLVGWETERLWTAGVFWLLAAALTAIGALAATGLMLRDGDRRGTAASTPPVTNDDEIRAAGAELVATLAVLPRAVGWMLVAALATSAAVLALVVVFVIAWPLGLLAMIACVPLGFFLIIRWAFVGQAIVDRPGNPFRRSTLVSRDRFWPVCGRVLLMAAIAYGMSIAGNLVITPVSGFGGFGSGIDFDDDVIDLGAAVTPSITAIVLTALVTAASAVFISGTIAAGFGELYRTRHPEHPAG